jgi:hypothetical protein
MNRIYLTAEGETIGLGTQSLRKHFNATIPDPPKPSDLAFLGVKWADVPPEPKSIDTAYTLSATVVDGVAVVKWVGAPRSSKDTQQRREEWDTQSASQVKAEAGRRIDAIASWWKQINVARENPSDPIFSKIDDVRKKSDQIEAHLATLTDAEAGAYDIQNSPLWD